MGDLSPEQDHSSWWVLMLAVLTPIVVVICFCLVGLNGYLALPGVVLACLSSQLFTGRAFTSYARETGARYGAEFLWRPRYVAFHARRLGIDPKRMVRLVVVLWLAIPASLVVVVLYGPLPDPEVIKEFATTFGIAR